MWLIFFAGFLGVVACMPDWRIEHTWASIERINSSDAFHDWSLVFEKNYESDEEEKNKRFKIWLDNLDIIAAYNSQDLGFKLRFNQFGDLTTDEFRRYVHGKDGACFKNTEISNRNGADVNTGNIGGGGGGRFGHMNENPMYNNSSSSSAPTSVDWTDEGVVTPVKDQGQCGSCWAFSATGAIECQYAIQNGTLTSLSEQQLMDCAGVLYGCFGCQGGEMTGAMSYASRNGGLCTEEKYQYTAMDGNVCQSSTCGKKYNANTGYSLVTPYSSSDLMKAAAIGCVSIGIEADQTAFQHYSSGILSGTCGTEIDHGVLVVGYGTSGDDKYWKVKNSWGENWGEDGYVRICRDCNKNGVDGECGILSQPSVPTF